MDRKSSTCSGFSSLIVLLLLLSRPVVAASGCGWTGSPEQPAHPVRVLALEYPLGTTLDQWLERVDTRITCRLFRQLHLKPDFILLPYKRAFAEMEADKAGIDIMVGSDYIFDSRTRCKLKMIPYRRYRVLAYYYARERQVPEPTTLSDFAGKRIATLGPRLFGRITGLKDVEIVSALDIETKFAILFLGRADYALALAGEEARFVNADGQLREEGWQVLPEGAAGAGAKGYFFSVPTPFTIATTGLVVNLGRPGMRQLADRLAATLEQLRTDSSFRDMVQHDPAYFLEMSLAQHSILTLEDLPPEKQGQDGDGTRETPAGCDQ